MKRFLLGLVLILLCILNTSLAFAAPENEDVQLIKSKGIDDVLINKLGDDADIVADLIQSSNLNETQIKNFITGLTDGKFDKVEKREVKDGQVEVDGQIIAVPDISKNIR